MSEYKVRKLKNKQNKNISSFRFVIEEKVLEIEVEPGVHNGYEIPFLAEGEPHIEGEPGDLKFIIRVQKYCSLNSMNFFIESFHLDTRFSNVKTMIFIQI